jgi:hypothetical protein
MRVRALGFPQMASHATAALDSNSTPTGQLDQRRAVSFQRSYASLPTFMQVLCPSPPTIIATCVHSAEGRRGPLPAPPPALMGQNWGLDAAMLICPCDLANASAGEAAQLCRLPPVHEHSLATEDEYGIASNAVTVLEPDLVESVALSTPNLLSHFLPKLDSGRPSLFWRSPQDTLSAESAVITVQHFPLQSSNSLYLSLTTVAAYFHSLILECFEIEESWLFSLLQLISVCSAERRTPNQQSSW